jgi:hypothetical protein
VGWLLGRQWWGQGLATEAALAWCNYAFTVLGADEVISVIHPDNGRSIAVAECIGHAYWRDWEHDGQRLSMTSGWRRTDPHDHAGARRDLARPDGAQRREARAVFVAQRQVEERIADGAEPFLLQLSGTLRPDSLHVLQRRAEADGRVRLPGLGHRVIKPAGSTPVALRPRRSAMQFEE